MTRRAGLALMLACTLLTACGSDLPPEQQIGKTVADAAKAGFSGTVLVTRGGKPLFEASTGMSDRAAGTPNAATTRYSIASVSKPFTAVLVMQLIEQHKLSENTRLDAVFPATKGTPAGTITVGQLLSHTSGIEELTERHLDRPLTPADLPAAKLIYAPGGFHYSSAGYVVLKLVIEAVGGKPFAEQLTERIFAPAHMTDSGVLSTGLPVERLAVGYSKDEVAKLPVHIELLDGAGSLYATASDLAKFDRALATHTLLSAEIQKIMTKRRTAQGDGDWAYGWALAEQGGHWYPWHSGDLPGYSAALVRQTHRDALVVILSNTEAADVADMRKEIMRVLKKG